MTLNICDSSNHRTHNYINISISKLFCVIFISVPNKFFQMRRDEFLICTFSNPLVGCVKASIFLSSEGGTDQIEALWQPMDECAIVREAFYGCYREADKHITFVCKDSSVPW